MKLDYCVRTCTIHLQAGVLAALSPPSTWPNATSRGPRCYLGALAAELFFTPGLCYLQLSRFPGERQIPAFILCLIVVAFLNTRRRPLLFGRETVITCWFVYFWTVCSVIVFFTFAHCVVRIVNRFIFCLLHANVCCSGVGVRGGAFGCLHKCYQ